MLAKPAAVRQCVIGRLAFCFSLVTTPTFSPSRIHRVPPSPAAECARFSAFAGFKAAAADLCRSSAAGKELPAASLEMWLFGRKLIEDKIPDPDGRQWDDPLIPWRFVDQVDSNFVEEAVKTTGIDVKLARKLSRKLGRLAHRTHKNLRQRLLGGALGTQQVTVYFQCPGGNKSGRDLSSSSSVSNRYDGAQRRLQTATWVVVKSGQTVLRVNKKHYDKLREIFERYLEEQYNMSGTAIKGGHQEPRDAHHREEP